MKKALLIAAGIIALAGSAFAAAKPNIIYIYTDDWGIGKVPCYNMDEKSKALLKTPNLDRLRSEGMLFTNGYCANAVCGPSRNSILTGRHPGHAAWRQNAVSMPPEIWPSKTPMLGKVAQQAGYKTYGFGKLSAGGTETPEFINEHYGFDYWLGYLGHVDCRSFYNDHVWETGQRVELPNDQAFVKSKQPSKKPAKPGHPVRDGEMGEDYGVFTEDLYADKIIGFIKENKAKEQPFFIYFASCVPHGGAGFLVPDLEGYDELDLTASERVYCALMARHDRNVGRIMDAVRAVGAEKDTIIIWTSDNGDEDSYYHRTDILDGNGPFREQKRSLYDGGIRAPMLAWWPGTIKPNSTCELITSQIDLMPTIAEAGGLEPADYMDGISILPTLRGEPDKQIKRDYLYWEYHTRGGQQAVRMGKWKAYRVGGPGTPMELYDIESDLGEENNLAAQHPELVAQMERIMAKEHTEHPKYRFDSEKSSKHKEKRAKDKGADKKSTEKKPAKAKKAAKEKDSELDERKKQIRAMTPEERAAKQKAKELNRKAKEQKRKEKEAMNK